MRLLSEILRSAQQAESVVPVVKVTMRNRTAGALRLDWQRLYTGSEPAGPHAAAMPSDGSLVRSRITPAESGRALLRQRMAAPGPASDFSAWANTGYYGAVAAACCAVNSEVSIFWIDTTRKLQQIKSLDCGISWTGPVILDYTPTNAIGGLAAAYKPNGDLAVFFTDQQTLYVKKYSGSSWNSCLPWNKTTGDLSGLACIYLNDWCLLLTGKDTSDSYKLWSLIYGDGGEISPGTWSDISEVASAPAGENFEFHNPSLDFPDLVRGFFIESYTGIESYARPFRSHNLSGSAYRENLWKEPLPFEYSGGSTISQTHHGDYVWLSCPDGVWRASMTDPELDLSGDVISLKAVLTGTSAKLVVELRNDDGRYANLAGIPDTGCRIGLGLGCRTGDGVEIRDGPAFFSESFEFITLPNRASLIVSGGGGWEALQKWTARSQLRWNKTTAEANIKQIIEAVLARAGLSLTVVSLSAAASGFYPDFTIKPGENGVSAIKKLLSFIPDLLFFEGETGYLLNPLPTDPPVYGFGTGHVIKEGTYRDSIADTGSVRVEGYDPASGAPLLCDVFDWDAINADSGSSVTLSDRNLVSIEQALDRGNTYLRKERMHLLRGAIRTPVNCGQQLYDVVAITEKRAGLEAEPMRVLSITIDYDTSRGEYEQRLTLGRV